MKKNKNKIALCLIVKGTDEEALLLDRCLNNVSPFVDGIFVTSTYKDKPNEMVEKIAKSYNANVSTFKWINDFSEARNFNFSQVPKEYDYILWCDADDLFRGLEKLQPTIEAKPEVDGFALWYLYEFDENKQVTVAHKKTQIIKNDGATKWVGALHEDLMPQRSLNIQTIEGIDRMHFPNENHAIDVGDRNVSIAEDELAKNPKEPRGYFNLGNSYMGITAYSKAVQTFEIFMKLSNSDDEKYIALLRLASAYNAMGDVDGAIEKLKFAIGTKPDYPDAYLQMGYLMFDYGSLDSAEEYLLMGMIKKPPYHDIIVFNPRDYDFNPMQALSKVYFKKNRPDLALPLLEGCLTLNPDNENLKTLVAEMKVEVERLTKVVDLIKSLEDITDKEKIAEELSKIPLDLQSHPAICVLRNKHFVKETSSGKDITYYCGLTTHEWNPIMAKEKGIGGSEEAVINLSREWVKQGYNVTVYNNCGTEPIVEDGVVYKPFWLYNAKDKTDITIVWRHPKLLDYDINTGKIYVDVHDVISKGEFTEKRISKVDKVFVKTHFHRSLFPNIPDEKIAIVPNGMDFELFNQDITKNQYMLVNTSSPDRSMDVLPELFKRVKEKIPQARLKWAYGWEIFDNSYSADKNMMAWRNEINQKMIDAGIENMGRLSQKECAKLYLEGNILAYPSEFAEIDCITVKKAQACGCLPITTDFGAFPESVKTGVLIHSGKTSENWSRPNKWSYGIEDEKSKQEWVDAVVAQLQKPLGNRKVMKTKMNEFNWDIISNKWSKEF